MGESRIRTLRRIISKSLAETVLECSHNSITWTNENLILVNDPTLEKAIEKAGYGLIREFQPCQFRFYFTKRDYEGLRLQGHGGETLFLYDYAKSLWNRHVSLREAGNIELEYDEKSPVDLDAGIEGFYNRDKFVRLATEDRSLGFFVQRECHEYVIKSVSQKQRKQITIAAPRYMQRHSLVVAYKIHQDRPDTT